MHARGTLLLALLFALAAIVPLSPSPAATQAATPRTEAELRAGLEGAWIRSGSRAEAQAIIDRGIERCVADMNYFLQGVARDQLHANTPVNDRLDFGLAGTDITIGFDQRFSYTLSPGMPQDFDVEGTGTVSIRHYFRDGHLEQFFDASLGDRWNVFELSADGTTMTMSATQQGPMMPVPMHFSLRFHR